LSAVQNLMRLLVAHRRRVRHRTQRDGAYGRQGIAQARDGNVRSAAVPGLAFMSERLASQWLAVGLICGGVLAMFASARATGATAAGPRRTTLLALCTACVIACGTATMRLA